MRSLILKDLLPQWKSKGMVTGLICVVAAAYFAKSGSSVAAVLLFVPAYYAASYSSMYDYRYNQERFFLSLPVTRPEWVASRYLSILVYFAAALALSVAFGLAARAAGLPFAPPSLPLAASAFAAASFYLALSLPAYFALGYERYKWLNFIIMIASAVISSIAQEAAKAIQANSANVAATTIANGSLATAPTVAMPAAMPVEMPPVASLAAIGIGIAALALSCLVSVRLFSKREF